MYQLHRTCADKQRYNKEIKTTNEVFKTTNENNRGGESNICYR